MPQPTKKPGFYAKPGGELVEGYKPEFLFMDSCNPGLDGFKILIFSIYPYSPADYRVYLGTGLHLHAEQQIHVAVVSKNEMSIETVMGTELCIVTDKKDISDVLFGSYHLHPYSFNHLAIEEESPTVVSIKIEY